jgi:hypothetical protein
MKYLHLTDPQMVYPEHLPPDEVVKRITAVLAASKNAGVFLNPALGLANGIHRAAFHFGVSPLIPLMAFEREQSLLTQVRDPLSEAWQHACGVVGQDGPGTVNHRWDGLMTQIFLVCMLHAWYMGIGPDQNFGYRQGLWPTAAGRWERNTSVMILDENHKSKALHLCDCAAEYAQLTFTPHLGLGDPKKDSNTLDVNAEISSTLLTAFL